MSSGASAGCGPHVVADRRRFRQVLLNLLTNGVKFNRPHGSVTVSCRQRCRTRSSSACRTPGAAIPEELIDQIFMPFERLDAARHGIEGAGVGLALAKQLTEAMGGAIGVDVRARRRQHVLHRALRTGRAPSSDSRCRP